MLQIVRNTLILIGFMGLLSLAWAQQSSSQDDQPASAGASETDSDEDDEKLDERVFKPSEQISEDNSVPFPVDI